MVGRENEAAGVGWDGMGWDSQPLLLPEMSKVKAGGGVEGGGVKGPQSMLVKIRQLDARRSGDETSGRKNGF